VLLFAYAQPSTIKEKATVTNILMLVCPISVKFLLSQTFLGYFDEKSKVLV